MWLTIARTVVTSLTSMGMALLSEVFLKDIAVMLLEKLVAKFPSEEHSKALAAIRHAWGLQ
jgi:hypothetical protein